MSIKIETFWMIVTGIFLIMIVYIMKTLCGFCSSHDHDEDEDDHYERVPVTSVVNYFEQQDIPKIQKFQLIDFQIFFSTTPNGNGFIAPRGNARLTWLKLGHLDIMALTRDSVVTLERDDNGILLPFSHEGFVSKDIHGEDCLCFGQVNCHM